MKLLVLTFYYPPDLSAGSFRVEALVQALRDQVPPGSQIDVITTLPNRYHSFSVQADSLEEQEGLRIRRFTLPPHENGMRAQARAFLSYAKQALRETRAREYDFVFATSSRLMTAALAAWIARRKRVGLYLDIRDIFVDTIKDVLRGPAAKPVEWLFSKVESWTVRRATRINLVSPGFEPYFRRRYGDRSFSAFTNGVDPEFMSWPPQTPRRPEGRREVTILYAGNVGDGQALHTIVPGLAEQLRGCARFVVIGDGGRRRMLEQAVTGLSNIELKAPMTRERLREQYAHADVLFLHLGDLPAFKKVLPSKIFEYAALGKPILAGVAGYAAEFLAKEVTNAAVFPPGNVVAGVAAFESLHMQDVPRPEFVEKYSRERIARAMALDILSCVGRAAHGKG